jgi:hypothetical protein
MSASPGIDRSLLHPVECASLTRLGRAGDGGYVVPADQLTPCRYLLSLGINDDPSFDRDFLEAAPDARAIGVDATVNRGITRRRILQSRWGILRTTVSRRSARREVYRERLRGCLDLERVYGPPNRLLQRWVSADPGPGNVTLGELMDLCPATDEPGGHDVFLKMDIEGAEWDLAGAIVAHTARIRAMAIEFHGIDLDPERTNTWFRDVGERFAVVHVHGNNYSPFSERDRLPRALEVSFVNRSLLPPNPPLRSVTYPLEGLDLPCDRTAPDLTFSFP